MSQKPFPKPIPFRRLLGPSFIILALGLGSGEVILWPYLSSNYGLGIVWGAILGISCQFFINMEIERYALVRGESVFVGLAKRWRYAPYWFIFSTFVGFGLPGIVAASAHVFAAILGIENFKWIAIVFLLLIGVMLSVGKTVYGMMEKFTRTLILLAVPFILVLAILVSDGADWLALSRGFLGYGEGFRWLPDGIVLATFFAAFAYSGAGGNLNLTQSIYVKEKGYGMGAYAQKIAGLFQHAKKPQEIKLEGTPFEITEENLSNFRVWWRRINAEHLTIFWFLGASAMTLLMLLAYATTFGTENNAQGIQFVINQGGALAAQLGPIIGTLFLLAVSIMLFQTQLGVMDSTSRIMAENMALKQMEKRETKTVHLSRIYFTFLWAQIAFGIILFLLNITEPKFLIVLGAVLNAFAMFVHIGLVNWMNHKTLPKEVQAAWWRKLILLIVFLIFGAFSVFTIWERVKGLLMTI